MPSETLLLSSSQRCAQNVGVEPQRQPLSGERFPLRSTNLEDNARPHIRAQNLWDKSKRTTFFDGSLTPTLLPIAHPPQMLATGDMNRRKSEATSNGSLRWSMGLSPWSYPPVVGGALQPRWPTRGWLVSSPRSMANRTAPLSAGSDAGSRIA